MPNIVGLAYLDTFELAASLPRRMGPFKDGALPIRGPRAGADDPDDDVAYVAHMTPTQMNKWPELKSAIARIKRIGDQAGGVEFGRIFLELMPAGIARPWEPPATGYFERFNRLAVALRTNPGVVHYSGVESLHLAHGVVTWINQRAWRSAINIGETSAILLVVDTKVKEAKDG